MSATLPIIAGTHSVLEQLLAEQQSLTAVQRFSTQQALTAGEPRQARYYRDLLPATPPAPGQQYAFQVDLDVCSGCKACVVACHTLNGLDEAETWRNVGTLSGGTEAGVQHVTTACHHCVDPGCVAGCPVNAYDKDPATGIVRHLDDQCIGCKYCTMMCPYEVPQYNDRLGIVRKCDMCHQRLAVGEAPACVQACPNEAIRIRLVEVAEVESAGRQPAASLVSGAPPSAWTLPTTSYVSVHHQQQATQPLGGPIDQPAESHWPLAVMLVLTQASVGVLIVQRVAAACGLLTTHRAAEIFAATCMTLALLLAVAGLAVAPLHLGQPLKAWRVFLGLRTSWLSREAIVLGGYGGLLAVAAALGGFAIVWPTATGAPLAQRTSGLLATAAMLTGIGGVYCSGMLYVVTRRHLWRPSRTLTRFLGTMLAAGVTATLPLLVGVGTDARTIGGIGMAATVLTLTKLVWEWRIQWGPIPSGDAYDNRSRRLARRPLYAITRARLTLAWLAAVSLLIAVLLAQDGGPAVLWFATVGAVLMVGGEIAERVLYFTAVVYDRMPEMLR